MDRCDQDMRQYGMGGNGNYDTLTLGRCCPMVSHQCPIPNPLIILGLHPVVGDGVSPMSQFWLKMFY